MEFKKYQHIERFDTDETAGIEVGTCFVFPKIDGTNSSVWLNDHKICAGGRNRELTIDNDNAGFLAMIQKDNRIFDFLSKYPNHRLFGEYLIPHSLKTYRENAWNKFYVFDVCVENENNKLGYDHLSYDIYQPMLEEFDIDYIMPLKIIKNGSFEHFIQCLEANFFLIQEGQGVGEGIVIKNYEYFNQYGRPTWAKIVRSEFKEANYKLMGAPLTEKQPVESQIVKKYVTEAFIRKEYAKMIKETGGWNSQKIPVFLHRVYREFICEETWNFVQEYKNPKINFRNLYLLTVKTIRESMPELF